MNQCRPNAACAALLCLLTLMVGGCGKGKDDLVVGKWKDPQGNPVVFKADKTYTQGNAPMQATGKWTIDGDIVTLRVEIVMGQPADKVLPMMAERLSHMSPKAGTPADIIKQMKAIELKLGEDGRTMSATSSLVGPGGMLTKDDSK